MGVVVPPYPIYSFYLGTTHKAFSFSAVAVNNHTCLLSVVLVLFSKVENTILASVRVRVKREKATDGTHGMSFLFVCYIEGKKQS